METVPPAAEEKPVPADAPVITIQGFCEKKPSLTPSGPAAATSPDCKTIITRAQFEKIVDAVNPGMAPNQRMELANAYTRLLVVSAAAQDRGLDQTPRFAELMRLQRIQALGNELFRSLREQAKPTPAAVETYFKEHQKQYEEASLKRLFIPKNRPDDKEKPEPAALKAEAGKIRERAAAGEDFDKLEKEIYEKAGIKTSPPPTAIPVWRRDAVPPTQAQVFDLQPGQISPVIEEPGGFYIYRVESKRTLPLDQVRSEIENNITNERFRSAVDSILAPVKSDYNPAYFRTGAAGPNGQGQLPPGAPPRTVRPMAPPKSDSEPKPAQQPK